MRVRMKTLQREADIANINADKLICHLMSGAWTDPYLSHEMMKIKNMIEIKLNEAVDKYETLLSATKGLNKNPKEEVKRVKDDNGRKVICFRCQEANHMADACSVPASALKCTKCNMVEWGNTHKFVEDKGRTHYDDSKRVEVKDATKKEEVQSKRVVAQDESPAGCANESSYEEFGFGKQVKVEQTLIKSRKKKGNNGFKQNIKIEIKKESKDEPKDESIDNYKENIDEEMVDINDGEDGENEEETASPLPYIVCAFNCRHTDCWLDGEERERQGQKDAFARLGKHKWCTLAPGKKKCSPTPPMPVRLSIKAGSMIKEGKEIVSCPDTGATVTIVNEDVARENKLKWKTSATGAPMRVCVETTLFAKVRNDTFLSNKAGK